MKKVFFGFLGMVAFAVVGYGLDAATAVLFTGEEVTDHGGQDVASAVVISGDTAIVAEYLSAPGNGTDFTVKAVDALTGQTKWENHIPSIQGSYAYLATSGDTVFALRIPASYDFFLRAYSISTGNVLWTHYGTTGIPQGIAVAGGRVTIVGSGGTTLPGERPHGVVRTLNAETGAVLWTSIIIKPNSFDSVASVASDGTRVFTAGDTFDINGQVSMVLRSYNAQTGSLLWEKIKPLMDGWSIQANAGRVFVAGTDFTSSKAVTFFGALDPLNGELLWQAAGLTGYFTGLSVTANQAVAAGFTGRGGSMVQSVNPATGIVQWSAVSTPLQGATESFRHVVATDHGIYAVGGATQNNPGSSRGFSESMLKVYGLDGTLISEERSHRSNRTSMNFDVAVSGRYLATAGFATNLTDDAVMRRYDVSAIETPVVNPLVTVIEPQTETLGRVLIDRLIQMTPSLLTSPLLLQPVRMLRR